MDPAYRAAYNAAFTPAGYARYKQRLEAEVGPIPFRLAESPVFVPAPLRDQLFRATNEIIAQLIEPGRMARARKAVPADFDVPGLDETPAVMTVDFAVVEEEGGALAGRVVELQAFPSLFAFTQVQARLMDEQLQATAGIARGFHCFAPGLDFAGGLAIFRGAVVGEHDPEHVVLLEIEPDAQKTRPDFVATKKLIGVDAVCVTEVIKEGRKLFRRKEGRLLPIHRIYNRVVFDELHRKRPKMAFSFTDELDVSWCAHPNWYWLWSKFSLPLLDHPAVPPATLISELQALPEDLGPYVLKPLFSYAGAGVKVDVTPQDVADIPAEQRGGFVLQRKIEYARKLMTPEGHGVAAEVRMLCLRPPGERLPRPFMNLIRLSRGRMLGIDFNKDFDWVGSSVGLWPR